MRNCVEDIRRSTPYDDLIDRIQNEELAAVLWPMVDMLPEDQREVIRLRYCERLSLKEIPGGRTLERKAMGELRKPYNANRLQPFLPDNILSIAYGGGVESFKRTWTSSTERAAIEHLKA